MLEKFKGRTWLVRLSAGYYGCVHTWKRPVQESLVPLKQAHRAGLESGDIEFAMLSANMYTWSQVRVLEVVRWMMPHSLQNSHSAVPPV